MNEAEYTLYIAKNQVIHSLLSCHSGILVERRNHIFPRVESSTRDASPNGNGGSQDAATQLWMQYFCMFDKINEL